MLIYSAPLVHRPKGVLLVLLHDLIGSTRYKIAKRARPKINRYQSIRIAFLSTCISTCQVCPALLIVCSLKAMPRLDMAFNKRTQKNGAYLTNGDAGGKVRIDKYISHTYVIHYIPSIAWYINWTEHQSLLTPVDGADGWHWRQCALSTTHQAAAFFLHFMAAQGLADTLSGLMGWWWRRD